MGEARRRRLATEREVQTEPGDAPRLTVSVWQLGREHQERVERDLAGDRVAADVACRNCRACCYHPKIEVDPQQERPEDLAHLDLVPVPDEPGHLRLRKRDDGACVHLGPDGCAVYEHRPRNCRMYDCRPLAVANVRVQFDGGQKPPLWVPAMATAVDRAGATLLVAAAEEFHRTHSTTEDADASILADYVWRRLTERWEEVRSTPTLWQECVEAHQRARRKEAAAPPMAIPYLHR